VRQFRAALSNPADQRVRAAGRTLHQDLIASIQTSLTNVERIIVSPDGALNLFPFAALVGTDDEYVVEHVPISYVTSGRDLLRMDHRIAEEARTLAPPIIVADPLFRGTGSPPGGLADQARTTRTFDARVLDQTLRFTPLPGTAQEANALARVLPEARVYMGATANEAMLKQLSAPTILHIATHGFFRQPRSPAPALDREDAMVRSGLALAGANRRSSGGGEDGLLTALEVAGLDLWGTRMVVLSACETGLGDARNGEGVYGLRRALVLAGSESQVISLWKVSDSATRDLMIGFYQRLHAGEGRAEALRNAQLAMLRGPRWRHPFFWAGFIESGDWRAF
jgi:CHAT domain-containing protein